MLVEPPNALVDPPNGLLVDPPNGGAGDGAPKTGAGAAPKAEVPAAPGAGAGVPGMLCTVLVPQVTIVAFVDCRQTGYVVLQCQWKAEAVKLATGGFCWCRNWFADS